jgi:hypothetical protein
LVGRAASTDSEGAGASVASTGGDVGGGAGVAAWAQAASTNTPDNNIGKNLVLRIMDLILISSFMVISSIAWIHRRDDVAKSYLFLI